MVSLVNVSSEDELGALSRALSDVTPCGLLDLISLWTLFVWCLTKLHMSKGSSRPC